MFPNIFLINDSPLFVQGVITTGICASVLFMAGRNISVTHVALGTVRVMRTTGMMGEVVGMAASLCKKYNTTPRGVYQKHLPELKALMKEGVGKKEGIPDNQKFNEQKLLKKPRIFAIEKNKK